MAEQLPPSRATAHAARTHQTLGAGSPQAVQPVFQMRKTWARASPPSPSAQGLARGRHAVLSSQQEQVRSPG